MTQDDVLFGYRLRLLRSRPSAGSARPARLLGVHRSTYHRWKRAVERAGLEVLRPA